MESVSLLLFLILGRDLLPLDISSVVTTTGNDISVIAACLVVESHSWDMLRVTCHSSTCLSVLQNWAFVDAHRSEIITDSDGLLIWGNINCVDISSIGTLWEYTHDFPTELACSICPHVDIGQRILSFGDLLFSSDIVEKLGVGLINSSEVFGILGPIHCSDC